MPLATYNERPIVIKDDSIGGRQLTGVFDADDPGSLLLLLFLAKDPGMGLEERGDVVIVRAAAVGHGPGLGRKPAATRP